MTKTYQWRLTATSLNSLTILNEKKKQCSYPEPCFVNVGTGRDCTIKDLALLVKEITGFEGNLEFDTSKPDGTPLKRLDVSRLEHLGRQAKISLEAGIGKPTIGF